MILGQTVISVVRYCWCQDPRRNVLYMCVISVVRFQGVMFYIYVCDFCCQVLLVSGSKDPDRWVVPGGGIEPTEDAGVAAIREVQEEAGVKGDLGRCLGVFEVS